MIRATFPCLLAASLLLGACTSGPTSSGGLFEKPVEASELNTKVSLKLSTDTPKIDVGDDLKLHIEARNKGEGAVKVIRPLDGSWSRMREPHYSVDFLDDAGKVIPNAMGFGPTGRCGMVNPIVPGDVRRLRPGATTRLTDDAPFMPRLTVHPSARPGTYNVRVRYRALKLSEATALKLVSNTVKVTITGGDANLWRCRQNQLDALTDYRYTEIGASHFSPIDPSDLGKGFWLVTTRFSQRVRPTERDSGGKLVVQRLDGKGKPLGSPLVVDDNKSESVGYAVATRVPDGLVVVYTPGGVGGREVRSVHIKLDGQQISHGSTRLISAPPGNPYVTALRRHGNTLALVYEGNKAQDEALMFVNLDLKGVPLRKPTALSTGHTSRPLMATTQKGFLVLWNEGPGKQRLQTLDLKGKTVGSALTLSIDTTGPVGLEEVGGKIHLVYQDSSVRGNVSTDTMGMYLVVLNPDGTVANSPAPLTPLSRDKPHFGEAAWSSGRIARIYEQDRELRFGIGTSSKPAPTLLSRLAGGSPHLWTSGGHHLVAWQDFRDDKSLACQNLKDCVSEAYVAVLDNSGKMVIPPTRATEDASAKPINPRDDEWADFCDVTR